MCTRSGSDDARSGRAGRCDSGGVRERRAVVSRDQDAAVNEHLRFAGTQQGRGPPDLTESAEGGNSNVVLSGRHLACEATSDLLEERLSLVVDRPEILADLFDGLRRNGRRPDDLWGPPDLFLDLVENRTVAADDHSRREGLDRHLARLRLEIDPGNLRLRRDDLADDLLPFLRRREQ